MATPPPPYNPSGWTTNPATWPPPIPPATLYQPGMAWTMTAAGTVDGQAVKAGDLLFVVHKGRLYGADLYGGGLYGSPPDGDWTATDVRFVAWYSSALPPDQPPYPYAGCKFGDTGWWIIVDAFYLDRTDSRLYSTGTYGSATYGGGTTAVAGWVDITAGFTDIKITRGTTDGAPEVDVCEIDITWYDPDFAQWDVSPPAFYYLPFVGMSIRVSFYDPGWVWHPRAVGAIEQIVDPSVQPESETARMVTVQSFGHTMDLTRTLIGWTRGAELASARFAALLTAAGWRYGLGGLTYPPDVALHADTAARTVTGRAELDRTARSAGWTFDTDRRGQPRLRTWPLPATGPVTTVIDCADHGPTGLVATVIVFTADESQLLNIVQASNALATPAVVSATDATSVQLYGPRDNSLGFPATGLAFANTADGQALVNRVKARYSRIVTHPEPVVVDTDVDDGWLPVLADLDTGEHWTITRVHPTTFTMDSVVVGVEETIVPGKVTATVFTTTTTPTL